MKSSIATTSLGTALGLKSALALGTALALATVAGTAGAAAAAPDVCTSPRSDDRTGDLTVPADATCVLTDVVVRGDLTVQRGATVNATATAVRGKLTLTSGATVTLTDARVSGAIVAGSRTTRVQDAALTVRSSVARSGFNVQSVPSGRGGIGQPLELTIDRGSRVGSLHTKGARIEVSDSRINGDLISDWGHAVTVNSSVVRGATTVANSYGGPVRVCGSKLTGSAEFSGSPMGTFVGDDCDGNVFRSDVTVDENSGVVFSNNLVRGAAAGTNAPLLGSAIFGHANRFQGSRSGDFANPALGR